MESGASDTWVTRTPVELWRCAFCICPEMRFRLFRNCCVEGARIESIKCPSTLRNHVHGCLGKIVEDRYHLGHGLIRLLELKELCGLYVERDSGFLLANLLRLR